MTSTIAIATPRTTSTPRIAVALAAVLAVALLAAAGGWWAILALAGTGAHGRAAAGLGDVIPTSFGSLTIQRSDTLDGLTAQDLGGVTHGINDLVLSDSAQVEVTFQLANTSGAEARIDPDQFRLIVGGTQAALAPTGSTMRPTTLEPGARVGASVTFVVPRAGAQMTVRYTDPGSAAAVSVPLGRLDQAPPGAGNPPSHTH